MRLFHRLSLSAAASVAIACESPAGPGTKIPNDSPPTDTSTAAKTLPVITNGMAQVVPAFADTTTWIRQELWVETTFDSDGDGRRDRMHVDVTRQRQTETEGLKVPVVFHSSPYFAGVANVENWNVVHEIGATPPPRTLSTGVTFKPVRPRISLSDLSTWVPRGFAVVHSEAPGTGLSEGCVTIGGETEALAPKAVIDWLNGRAKGYTTISGTDTVSARWSTGKVGMIGTSYDGTLAVAAATTGVQGLEAIIPISPLTSYYDYYRSNGLVRSPGGFLGEDVDVLYDFVNSGDPAKRGYCNGTYRDGVLRANQDRITGERNAFWESREMLSHATGFHAAALIAHGLNDWNVMPSHGIKLFELLRSRGVPAHLYLHLGGHGGPPPLDLTVQWFTRFLYGTLNGVDGVPRAHITTGSVSVAYDDYPNPAASPIVFQLRPGGNMTGGLGAGSVAGQGIEKFMDNVDLSGANLAASASLSFRLLYATAALSSPVHISGKPKVRVRIASTKTAANLSVWLVTLPYESSNTSIITRGWADPHFVAPSAFTDVTFDLEPDDQIIPAGKQIGLMIFSSDREFTLWPALGTELSVDLSGTSLTLPIVGGAAAVPILAQRAPARAGARE